MPQAASVGMGRPQRMPLSGDDRQLPSIELPPYGIPSRRHLTAASKLPTDAAMHAQFSQFRAAARNADYESFHYFQDFTAWMNAIEKQSAVDGFPRVDHKTASTLPKSRQSSYRRLFSIGGLYIECYNSTVTFYMCSMYGDLHKSAANFRQQNIESI
jgi:hypothetical protein